MIYFYLFLLERACDLFWLLYSLIILFHCIELFRVEVFYLEHKLQIIWHIADLPHVLDQSPSFLKEKLVILIFQDNPRYIYEHFLIVLAYHTDSLTIIGELSESFDALKR